MCFIISDVIIKYCMYLVAQRCILSRADMSWDAIMGNYIEVEILLMLCKEFSR